MNLRKFFNLICFLLLFSGAFAQQSEELITLLSEEDLGLTEAAFDHLNFLKQDSLIDSIYLIEFGNAALLANEGILEFSLPGFEDVESEVELIEYINDSLYAWSANLVNYNGVFLMAEKFETKVAAIQIDGEFFDILPFIDGVNILRKFNSQEKRNVCGNFLTEIEDKLDADNHIASRANFCSEGRCPGLIEVLILLPPDAVNWLMDKFTFSLE